MLLYFHVYKQSIIRSKGGIKISGLSRVGAENRGMGKIGRKLFDLGNSVTIHAALFLHNLWVTCFKSGLHIFVE